MDLSTTLKDAAVVGVVGGIILMAIVLLWEIGAYMARPTVTVAAAITQAPFGFGLP